MFNLDRLSDLLTGGAPSVTDAKAGLIDALSAAGIDPSVLDGLDPAAVAQLLTDIGLDPAAFDLGSVTDHFGGASEGILGQLQEFMGQRDL